MNPSGSSGYGMQAFGRLVGGEVPLCPEERLTGLQSWREEHAVDAHRLRSHGDVSFLVSGAMGSRMIVAWRTAGRQITAASFIDELLPFEGLPDWRLAVAVPVGLRDQGRGLRIAEAAAGILRLVLQAEADDAWLEAVAHEDDARGRRIAEAVFGPASAVGLHPDTDLPARLHVRRVSELR